tara:strand:- start:328 stop:804 length:477 start_codon:yes stop_codon:yes gene_type:complete
MMSNSVDDTLIKINKIQKEWSDGIISIGKAHLEKKSVLSLTENFLDKLYQFDSKILFKPTKASKIQFRRNKNEFLSYFIGHNKISDEDSGFALEPWKQVTFENYDYAVFENFILSMGNYFFKNYRDEITKVEYSFGYINDKMNNLKIVFHHSSLPFKL